MSLAKGIRNYLKDEFIYKRWIEKGEFVDIDEEFVFELFEHMAQLLEEDKYSRVYITRILMIIQNIVNGINIVPFDSYVGVWKNKGNNSYTHKRDSSITKSSTGTVKDRKAKAFHNKSGDTYFKPNSSYVSVTSFPYFRPKVQRVYPDKGVDDEVV